MKFKKIGWNSGGGNVNNFTPSYTGDNKKLEQITSCDAEITKTSDVTEPDAIDLVTNWNFRINNDNNQYPLYEKFRKQHYRIYERDIKPNDHDLEIVIKDSYNDFKKMLEEIDKNINLSPLDYLLIENTLQNLKQLF